MRMTWWTRCREFARLSPRSQKRYGDKRYRSGLLRIAQLHEALGHVLDQRDAPLRVCKWIAWAPGSEQERAEGHRHRFNVMVRFRDERDRWPSDAEITALSATLPPRPPRTTAAARRAQKLVDFAQVLDDGLATSGLAPLEAACLREAVLASFVRTPS